MIRLNAKNIRRGRADIHFKYRSAQRAFILRIGDGIQIEPIVFGANLTNLYSVGDGNAGLIQPVTFGKFHGDSILFVDQNSG